MSEPTAAGIDGRSSGRATRRSRSAGRRNVRRVMLIIAALVGLYALAGVRILLSFPSPTTDYLAIANVEAAAVPEDERAWPLYRQALVGLKDGDFPDGHADDLALVRRAAGRAGFGFSARTGIAPEDSILWPEDQSDAGFPPDVPAMFSVRLPHLGELRRLTKLLVLDAVRAASEGRGDVVADDIRAICGMAGHVRELPFIINDLVGFSIVASATDVTGEILETYADRLSDDDLLAIAGELTAVDEFLRPRFDGERLGFADLLQHMYTDDGDGDGHLTAHGIRMLQSFTVVVGQERDDALGTTLLLPVLSAIDVGRKEMLATYDRLIAEYERDAARPQGMRGQATVDTQLEIWKSRPIDNARYRPLVLMMPALGGVRGQAEKARVGRDVVLVALARERDRRRHGTRTAPGGTE